MTDLMDDLESRTQAITLLLAEAETATDINALTRVARRAGFLWRCPGCRTDNYPTREACSCGTARPVGDDS